MAKSKFKVDFELQLAAVNADLAKMENSIKGMTVKSKQQFNSLSGVLAAVLVNGVSTKLNQVSNDISQMVTKTRSQFSSLAGSISQGMLQGVGQKLTGGLGSAMAMPGQMISKSLTDSMEFTAVNRKFDIVFGNLRWKAAEFSKDFSESINGSTTDTKAMMARFQDTLVPMGYSRREGFEKSKKMTTLATDLSASEPGMTTGDAAARLQSAMVGNHEAVRIFGISLSEASLKQELLNMNIKGGYDKATELQKATARLNIIMASSKDATGSAARASGDLRQQLGGFSAVTTEISARMGTILAPALAQVVRFFKEMGVEINKALGPSETWGKTLAEATKNILATMSGIKTVVADVAAGFASFTGSMSNGVLKATGDWSTFANSIGKVFDQAIVMLNPFILRLQDGFQAGMAGLAGGLMGLFGMAETSIKAVIDSILNSIISVVTSIEGAIEIAGNLNQLTNPVEMTRQASAMAEHAMNDSDNDRNVARGRAKKRWVEKLTNEKDPAEKAKLDATMARSNLTIDQIAGFRANSEEASAYEDQKKAINEKYGRDEWGHAAKKDTSMSDAIKKTQSDLKGPSTPGESLAEAMKKAWAGGKAGTDAYNAANPLGDKIAAADAAKAKAGEIKPKERGVIGWLDDLLTKGQAVSKSVDDTASSIEAKKTEQGRIKGDLATKIAKAKDVSGGIDLNRDVSAYAKYLDQQKNKGVEFSSSEDLSKKMQSAFDNDDGAKLALKAQQAIEQATKESNEKIQTLAKDIGSEMKDLLGWGA